MKKMFYPALLLFAFLFTSCGNKNNSSNTTENAPAKGNSAGSNIIEMDTMHMDTSGNNILTDSSHR
jgi:hypothetical protein